MCCPCPVCTLALQRENYIYNIIYIYARNAWALLRRCSVEVSHSHHDDDDDDDDDDDASPVVIAGLGKAQAFAVYIYIFIYRWLRF